jgi:Fic family protein
MSDIKNITITPEILKLIADIDEFKGRWKVIETLAPEKLTTLRRIATIESVGSSTRIEGAKLSDAEVEKLLSGLRSESFASRDEEEVAGYADAMDMIFDGYEAITTTENHIRQLHGVLLANRNTIKVHLKKLADQHYLAQVGKGRGARYTIK